MSSEQKVSFCAIGAHRPAAEEPVGGGLSGKTEEPVGLTEEPTVRVPAGQAEASACEAPTGQAEESACGGAPRQFNAETAFCMRPEQQVTRSHLPKGQQGPLWAGGRKVGNYSNSEEPVPEDTFFNTPFEGTQIRNDGTAGIVTDDDDFTGTTRPFGNRLPVEAGRFSLIWTPFCPWATRTKITLNLLGIGEDVIRTVRVAPVKTSSGWEFEGSSDLRAYDRENVPSATSEGAGSGKGKGSFQKGLTDLYVKTAPDQPWHATVPALVETQSGIIVNNDYHRLPHYFETAWKPFHKAGAPDLYPVKLRSQIDRLNRVLFNDTGKRVYDAGYAGTQAEYEHSFYLFFNRLGWLDRYLGKHRFLMGDELTDPDIRLYVVLARLDEAYYFAFRLNGMRLKDYENLWRYARELYEIPAFREATDFDAIRRGYYLGPGASNPFRIVPVGPDASDWAL